jgi:glucose/arabinose dehydrogenase
VLPGAVGTVGTVPSARIAKPSAWRAGAVLLVACVLASSLASAVSARVSAGGPKLARGITSTVFAQIPGVPAAIAFSPSGTTFVGSANVEDGSKPNDGVYVIERAGRARKVVSRPSVLGVAWARGSLLVASPGRVEAFSGWNGVRFSRATTVLSGLPNGIGGMAVGPDGRVYLGIDAGCDDCTPTSPLGGTVVSFTPSGGDLRVVARGLRKPFALAFPRGARAPVVTVVGQDDLGPKEPPEIVVRAVPGADFGWPACTWVDANACAGRPKPLVYLPAHSTPTGIAAIGTRLYIGLFVTRSVVTVGAGGGRVTSLITDLPNPVVALAARRGALFVGIDKGVIYRVTP